MMDISQSYGFSLEAKNRKLLANWLLLVAFLVFCMVVLGGVTRLTNSGLSMVEWKPVTGWLPPLSEEAWHAEFDKYKAFPEYQKINKGMSLDEFKEIFAFEYSHRVLGRLIGLAFAVPFFLFLILRKIPMNMVPRLVGLLILGGSQGVMGWVMVKSGLVDHPDVSHYRLTAHLGLAGIIFAALLWTAFELLYPKEGVKNSSALLRFAVISLALVFLQILIGGFVAGLNAGFIYNDWPTMGGGFMPDDIFHMSPLYLNFLENVATIQFTHRIGAYVVFAVIIVLFLKCRKETTDPTVRRFAHFLVASVFLQVIIGIWTLVMVVPVSLGALHQAGGMVVLGFAIATVHSLHQQRLMTK
ncbi:COX15/CtaA family protein [Sneathiella limimaris]|uniref:COX15/CtaA family protein n=1 Tax=Sneathiella limimaris TaxID=1964213 RepID=UPI00146A4CD7|nr:COX15/CtaA family protein [Sneathiella limimaris]